MKTLYAAMIAAGLMLGVGSAVARDSSSNTSGGQDAATQSQKNPGSEADERRARDSTQQGQTIPGPGAGKHPSDSNATTGDAVKTQESTGTGTDSTAGGTTDKMRNRDSSKQQDPNSPPKQ